MAVLVVVDWLCLLAISQPHNFALVRIYPNNVPIYHELEIEVLLTFDIKKMKQSSTSSLLQMLQKLDVAKHIQVEFYDSYPDQVTTQNHLTMRNQVTMRTLGELNTGLMAEQTQGDKKLASSKLTDSMPIRMTLDIVNNDSNASNHINDSNSDDTNTNNRLIIRYFVLPIERGTGYFGDAHLRLWSPFKLLRRQIILTEDTTNTTDTRNLKDKHPTNYLRVLADFSGLMNNQLAAVFEKSTHSGIQSLSQQGHGSDFLKLREYSAGDAIRQIDWKASSRQRRMMSKAYEEDNDQQVILLLDCGEQMRHQDQDLAGRFDAMEDKGRGAQYDTNTTTHQSTQSATQTGGPLSYFDQVLNAALLLAYVANKQGDSVGLLTFGGVDKYIPPKKGSSLIRDLLNETADIKPTMQTSDYYTAAQTLRQQLKKRSLVIMISNTRAEASEELCQAMQLLSHQHQVVFANLIEKDLDERLHSDNMPANFEEALLYHSLTGYEQSRQFLHQYLNQKTGALCLQTTANRLPMRLTQAYMSLKR